MIKVNNRTIILFCTLILAIFFRFYKIHDFLIFGMDQENENLIVQNMVSGKHFPLIGLSSSDTGIYRGPFFLYLSIIPHVLFNGSPLGGALFASLMGVAICLLLYKIGSKLFTKEVGLIAALLYSGSFLVSYYERQFWNPSFIPLFSLLIGYFAFRLINEKTFKLAVLISILFGVATHADLTILIFIPLIFYSFWEVRGIFTGKRLLILVFIFILTQSSLILFDIRHNFQDTKAIIRTIFPALNTSAGKIPSSSQLPLFLSAAGRFFWSNYNPDFMVESGQCKELLPLKKNQQGIGLFTIILIACCVLVWRRKKKRDGSEISALRIPLIIGVTTIVFTLLYNHQIFEYYFNYFFPWYALLISWSLMFLLKNNNKLILMAVALFIAVNMVTLLTANYSYSYKDKVDALNFAKHYVGSDTYTLEAFGECPRYGGLRYLAEFYLTHPPTHSYMDSFFGWLYPQTLSTAPAKFIVLLSMIDRRISPDLIYKWETIQKQYLNDFNLVADKESGKIHTYILTTKDK